MGPSIKKVFVLDSSVLLYDPSAPFHFQGHDVVVPIVVIEEVDHLKNDHSNLGRNARHISRLLDKLRATGSLSRGVPLEGGGALKVDVSSYSLDIGIISTDKRKPDNQILACARELLHTSRDRVILVSRDLNLRIKADAMGLQAEDYSREITEPDDDYKFNEFMGLPSITNQNHEISIRVFISHSSTDKHIAESFVNLLRDALRLPANDIRCTSVANYKLPAGTQSDMQLRQEVHQAETFLALLSPTSIQSTYVMFELGARWGSERYFAPVRVAGLQTDALKPPLQGINAIDGTDDIEIHLLMSALSKKLYLPLERPENYATALNKFILASGAKSPRPA